MSLAYTPRLLEQLRGADLLIDTCTIIDASKCKEIEDFLCKIAESDCIFLSTPSIKEEFTCSANSIEEYEELSRYIKTLQIVFLNDIPKRQSTLDTAVFDIALSRCKNIHPSFVDRALLSVPYLYRNSSEKIYIITSNYKDVPSNFFDRIGFITCDAGHFNNIGIYSFSYPKFKKIISDIDIGKIENIIRES